VTPTAVDPLMAEAQTVEFGPGGVRLFHAAGRTAGNCAQPACTRKRWAKAAWAIVAVTGRSAAAARPAAITIATGANFTTSEKDLGAAASDAVEYAQRPPRPGKAPSRPHPPS
jgi:hypothetical protein